MLIRSDDLKVIQSIKENILKIVLFKRIQHILVGIVQWKLLYVFRKKNIEADRIAKLAFDKNKYLQPVANLGVSRNLDPLKIENFHLGSLNF